MQANRYDRGRGATCALSMHVSRPVTLGGAGADRGSCHLAEGARAAEALAVEDHARIPILGPAAGGACSKGAVGAGLDNI